MNIKTESIRPDRLTAGDHVFDPNTKHWEPVQSAYWSEKIQRYVVVCGPLGGIMHTYGPGPKVNSQRYF